MEQKQSQEGNLVKKTLATAGFGILGAGGFSISGYSLYEFIPAINKLSEQDDCMATVAVLGLGLFTVAAAGTAGIYGIGKAIQYIRQMLHRDYKTQKFSEILDEVMPPL